VLLVLGQFNDVFKSMWLVKLRWIMGWRKYMTLKECGCSLPSLTF